MMIVWKSFVQTSPCCQVMLFQKLSKASERFDWLGSIRSPEMRRDTTSPVDLPKKGEVGSKMKFGQPKKRLTTFTRLASMLSHPARPRSTCTLSAEAVAQAGSVPTTAGAVPDVFMVRLVPCAFTTVSSRPIWTPLAMSTV